MPTSRLLTNLDDAALNASVTVPRPEIENTSSTGGRNGLSISRTGSGYGVQRFNQP
jgi:hypothetical protein